ncbi:MAG: hypothetical protein WEG56_09375 [Chloroflexota bacterium]
MTLQRVGGVMLAGLIALMGFAAMTATAAPALAGHNSAAGAERGTTGGWLDGRTVTFTYPKDFFCSEPPSSGADSGCELGAEPVKAPRAGSSIPVLYVMTPIGFRPAESTLQCPVVGSCINHPSTIDLSRVFGAGTENAALPAHSHIVDVAKGGWWEIEVIGVTEPAIWDQVVAAKSLDGVRDLQEAGVGITGDIPTNLFLFFNVQNR